MALLEYPITGVISVDGRLILNSLHARAVFYGGFKGTSRNQTVFFESSSFEFEFDFAFAFEFEFEFAEFEFEFG